MLKKISYAIMSGCLVFGGGVNAKIAYSNTDSSLIIKNEFENKALLNYVNGLNFNDEEAVNYSKKNGASAQYIVYAKDLLNNTGIDTKKLGNDLNKINKETENYFKEHKEYKGIFYTSFVFFPEYEGPYQFDVSNFNKDEKEEIEDLNELIEKKTFCKNDYCGAFLLMDVGYFPFVKNEKTKFDTKNYLNVLTNKLSKEIFKHYPTKKTNLSPVEIVVIFGTNGHLITQKQIEKFIKNELNEDKVNINKK